MQILIGCAKDMTSSCEWHVPFTTTPLWLSNAHDNAVQMACYSAAELEEILHVSPQMASEVWLRYQSFDNKEGAQAALQAYNGIVFKHMGLDTFSDNDFEYAQNHLWITSFLYGLLRPLDKISLYRLEGRVVLPSNGCNMFAYWKSRLTDAFIESIKSNDGVLVDLASSEMRSFFDWKRVEKEVKVVKPDFFVDKDGFLKSLSVYAKKGRGAMTGMIIRHQITSAEALKAFNTEGYHYVGDGKDELNPVFVTEL